MKLTITRIKPNPAGKDRPAFGGPTATQLASEWVDFRNDDGRDVSLAGVRLWHLAYPASGGTPEWKMVMSFTGALPNGRTVRVHSGQKRDLSVIAPADMSGADYHVFTGEDAYVWNNRQGDTPLLNDAQANVIDRAWYAPNPPEGAILVRQGDALVPAVARAANW